MEQVVLVEISADCGWDYFESQLDRFDNFALSWQPPAVPCSIDYDLLVHSTANEKRIGEIKTYEVIAFSGEGGSSGART